MHNNYLSAILVASASLISLSFLKQKKSLLNYLIVCIPYILAVSRFLFSSDLPIWDSWSYHFPTFKYIGDSIRNGHFFPRWFPVSGGVKIGFFHIQLFESIPHRLLGYCIYSILPMFPVFVYKFQYILGVIFMCFGWWLVLQRITHCQYASYFGTLMVMMGGTGITFHQEQALATTYLIPWFILSLLKLRENLFYIFPAIVLFGLGLNTHNIQIQYISMGLVFCLVVLLHPTLMASICRIQKRFFPIILLFFLLAILPSFYILNNIDTLASFVRKTGEYFRPKTYEEYLGLSIGGFPSAILSYYQQYINPVIKMENTMPGAPFDRCAFFVGRIALVFVMIGIFTKPFKKTILITFLLFLFSLLTLGVNSKIPISKFLFYVHFPLIDVFRQWYHFFPMINFSLSVLAAKGFARLFCYSGSKRIPIFILLALLFFQILDLTIYDLKYCSVFSTHEIPREISNNLLSIEKYEPANIFQFKNRFKLYTQCPQAIPSKPFLTYDIESILEGVDKERQRICEIIKNDKSSVVANIPPSILQEIVQNRMSEAEPRTFEYRSIGYDDLFLNISVSNPSLLVTPLNYDLGLKAYVDNDEVKVWRVNSALTGILVREGEHQIGFEIKGDLYTFILWTQIFLYIFLMLFPYTAKLFLQ